MGYVCARVCLCCLFMSGKQKDVWSRVYVGAPFPAPTIQTTTLMNHARVEVSDGQSRNLFDKKVYKTHGVWNM